jgi:hypothetical protein
VNARRDGFNIQPIQPVAHSQNRAESTASPTTAKIGKARYQISHKRSIIENRRARNKIRRFSSGRILKPQKSREDSHKRRSRAIPPTPPFNILSFVVLFCIVLFYRAREIRIIKRNLPDHQEENGLISIKTPQNQWSHCRPDYQYS